VELPSGTGVAAEPTRSRVDLAVDIAFYCLTEGVDGDGEVPPSFFRNEHERALAESLPAAEIFAATAAVMDAFVEHSNSTGNVAREVVNFADSMRADFEIGRAHV